MDDRLTSRPLPDAPILAALVAFGVWLAYATWPFAGIDVSNDYLPWFMHIEHVGIRSAFASPFGSYAPPYLYLLAAATTVAPAVSAFTAVKLVSYVGHLLLTCAVRQLLKKLTYSRPWTGAAFVVLAPSLFINPAILVQCDAYWAAALVMALTAALDSRFGRMFLWCGLAVGFKLQAAFAGPIFLALALAHRVPFRWWLMAPLGYLGTLLPAWMSGWPAADLLSIYLRQVDFTDHLSLAAPNIWTLIEAAPFALPAGLATIGSIAAVAASLAYAALLAPLLRREDRITILHVACVGALMVPGLLPRMHERYFFLADVLTLVLALAQPRKWLVALLVQFGSFAAIWSYITGATGLAALGAASMMIATWLMLKPLISNPGTASCFLGSSSSIASAR